MNKIFKSFRIVALFATLLFASSVMAQNRQTIKNSIKQWGQCNNVALTQSRGNVALYGNNGYSAANVPTSLVESLKELRQDDSSIKDVHISESGAWVVLCNVNGYACNDIPETMANRLDEFSDNEEELLSASFNDDGDWIVISGSHYSCSSTELQNWVKEGANSYGAPISACVTEDAAVVVYTGGYSCLGNIPDSLSKALDETEIDLYRLKVSGDSWFMCDQAGNYYYDM